MSEKMAKNWFIKASDILMTAPNPIGVTPKDLCNMIKKASPGGLTRANLQILGFHPSPNSQIYSAEARLRLLKESASLAGWRIACSDVLSISTPDRLA